MSGRSKARVSRARWERVWLGHDLGYGVGEIDAHLKLHHSSVSYYLRKGPPPGFARDGDGGQTADNRRPVARRKSADSQRTRGPVVVDFTARRAAR